MYCEVCGKNEGILTTIIINNVKTVKYICRECSMQKLFERERSIRQRQAEEIEEFFNDSFTAPPFGAFLPFSHLAPVLQQKAKEAKCEKCGRTLEEFKETSLVGCPFCYEAFAGVMKQVLQQCQPKTTHVGKAPNGSSGINAEYERLLKLLDLALYEQRYKDAAVIQEQMERLKNN